MLIAEDDPLDTFLLQRAIERSGLPIKPRFFRDGVEALEYLRGDPPYTDRKAHPLPRLVLLDIKMPRKNGFDVLREVRSSPGLRRLIAVMFSSSDLARDIDHAYDLGANGYVVKPYGAANMAAMLRRIHDFWFVTNRPSPSLHLGEH